MDSILEYINLVFLEPTFGFYLSFFLILIYFFLAKLIFKVDTTLNDCFNLALQGTSIHTGFILIFKVCYNFNNSNEKVFGIFETNEVIYIALGGLAVIYVSVDAIKKKYIDLKLSNAKKLPKNAT